MKHRRVATTAQTSHSKIREGGNVDWLTVRGARHNNLKNIDVAIPLGRFVCVTGVSGSGKSSLINDIVRERLASELNGAEKCNPGAHDAIDGIKHLDKVVDIDQTPIGRTPRSNPATYIKVFDEIRSLFAKLPDARVRGYKPGRFSFNVPVGPKGGGRCEACEGNGANKIEMDFLADVWVTCPVCMGMRFSRETLEIHFREKTIADVLDMEVAQALEHFAAIPKITNMLQTLHDVGLDYVRLGQSSTTLSGGEAQRIKLARELVKRSTGRTLYLLDEPTTGLHFDDVKKLLTVLHGFVDAGNTVVVIEHNLDVVKTADWVIDLGPEGGDEGGRIVAQGTPEHVAKVKRSYTGQALIPVLNGHAGSSKKNGTAESSAAFSSNQTKRSRKRLDEITVLGAKQHNLKDIDVRIPRSQSTVFCGPSGSGKSSLALDTIYTEGRRRYVESLSSYARQFLGQLQKPKVEHVHGLAPAIAIEQKAAARSPRSTVGTVTEIYDYMRVLWARIGSPHCPKCRVPIGAQTADQIVDRVLELGENTKALILAPVGRAPNESFAQLIDRQRANGFARVRIDRQQHNLSEPIDIDERSRHTVEVVLDRIVVRRRTRARITDSVEQALSVGNGVVMVQVVEDEPKSAGDSELRFSQHLSCSQCGQGFDELTPHQFSFNGWLGWCNRCEGLGIQRGASPDAIVVHPNRSLIDGALRGWAIAADIPAMGALLRSLGKHLGFNAGKTAWNALSESQRLAVLQGCGDEWIDWIPDRPDAAAWRGVRFRWNGYFPAIDRATRSSWQYRKRLEELVTDVPCQACGGSRLKPQARFVEVGGQRIEQVCHWPLADTSRFFKTLKLDPREKRIAGELLHEITARLQFLLDVGLEYLTLHRPAPTLSGGESQRIRLASQIGSGLTGVLYVLDEPTIGLHPRDNARLIGALSKLRDLGNTLIIVEHDREVIAHADHLLDFGPGAGAEGGTVVASGSPQRLRKNRKSLTGKFLSGAEAIAIPSNRRPITDKSANDKSSHWLTVIAARHHNLKEIDVAFPLGRFIAVTGVSGSGKSSLVSDTLYNALAVRIHRARLVAGGHERIVGAEQIDKVINVDQSPIGNSPSSNPATYTGVFDLIRELFAKLPESKIRGYGPNRFSFNRPGGRCEACAGNGQVCIEMHFLPDVWVECESCRGSRFLSETLDVRYKGKSIADVLDMRIAEAVEHFAPIPKVRRLLQTLDDVGLGYVSLGQPAPTLSGGEAQRVKLAAELGRPSTGKTLYILDEPTTGLHFDDLRKLLAVLHRLVDLGNTVICIEHNLDVIKTADYVIDIGPEAGDDGGNIVIAGTPDQVAGSKKSHTGAALAPVLAAGPVREREVFDPERQKKIEREIVGALNLGRTVADARMPWQVDGRKWHTVNHVDRKGQPVQWDPKLLEWIVDTLEKTNGFASPIWNDRARVEIKAPGSAVPWFAHLMTGDRDLLMVYLRVPPKKFDEKQLQRTLKIKILDERTDLPIYGQWPRVRMRTGSREHDDIVLYLRDFKDINKTTFREFLKQTAAAYLEMAKAAQSDKAKAQPWKTDGRAWHLSQRSVRKRHAVQWRSTDLAALLGRINKIDPTIKVDWSRKVAVALHRTTSAKPFGSIVTNMPAGLRCVFYVHRGLFTALQIERLGTADIAGPPSIQTRLDHDEITFWIRSINDCDVRLLAHMLAHTSDRPAPNEAKSA